MSGIVDTVEIVVPATSGNIGPGFDCLGVALTLYNSFRFTRAEQVLISAEGVGAERIAQNKQNLVYQSFQRCWQFLGRDKIPLAIHIEMQVPPSRGLGSSATAIAAGVYAANVFAGEPLTPLELVAIATEIEGHPDNVAPALLGGCRLIAGSEICEIPWHESIGVVVVIPEFELSTAKARQVLPSQISMADAVFNCAHLGLLTQALATGSREWLIEALQDKLHQPYRTPLIPALATVRETAMQAGAYGLVISGAGPSLLAIAPQEQTTSVGQAMHQAWLSAGINSQWQTLSIDRQGTQSLRV